MTGRMHPASPGRLGPPPNTRPETQHYYWLDLASRYSPQVTRILFDDWYDFRPSIADQLVPAEGQE